VYKRWSQKTLYKKVFIGIEKDGDVVSNLRFGEFLGRKSSDSMPRRLSFDLKRTVEDACPYKFKKRFILLNIICFKS